MESLWHVARQPARLVRRSRPVVLALARDIHPSPVPWGGEGGPDRCPTVAPTAAPEAIAPAPWPTVSVVIPTLNEAHNLPRVLEALPAAKGVEVIVVDGGSTDSTLKIAADWGARVVVSAPGRSRQMNQGAAVATGPMLLFLHADTRLPEGFDGAIREALTQPGVVAGAFRLAIDGPGRGLRWVERGVNVRSRLFHMPYGDQGIFLNAEVFHRLGGFPDLPMMEDFELVRRLRKLGKVAIAPQTVITSDRRWRTLGILRT
ncbi:MAG TPA: TIGR04283 family arsenosugar biosynthesis glycosyltransferase, partial [Nodosilinea sp.]|nr:TIGR04283 family arsenosugar biosynthesis glycosyltransferase [Nodosilinea sp.]